MEQSSQPRFHNIAKIILTIPMFAIFLIGCTSEQIDDTISASFTCPATEITPENIDTGNIAISSTQNVIEIYLDGGKYRYELSSILRFGLKGNMSKNILPSIEANGISFSANGKKIYYVPINEMEDSKISSCPKWYYPGFVYHYGNFNNMKLNIDAEKDGKIFKTWQMSALIDTTKIPILHETALSDSIIKIEVINRNPGMKQKIRFDYSTGLFSSPDSIFDSGNLTVLLNLNDVPFSNFQKITACGYEHYQINVSISLPIVDCDETSQICASSYQYIKPVNSTIDSVICKYRIDH